MITIRPMTESELRGMVEAEEADRDFHALTPDELEPLVRWVAKHIPPGDFLCAVIRNDLMEAAGRADLRNRRRLFEYTQWLYNEAPAACWGSKEKFEAWAARRGEACEK